MFGTLHLVTGQYLFALVQFGAAVATATTFGIFWTHMTSFRKTCCRPGTGIYDPLLGDCSDPNAIISLDYADAIGCEKWPGDVTASFWMMIITMACYYAIYRAGVIRTILFTAEAHRDAQKLHRFAVWAGRMPLSILAGVLHYHTLQKAQCVVRCLLTASFVCNMATSISLAQGNNAWGCVAGFEAPSWPISVLTTGMCNDPRSIAYNSPDTNTHVLWMSKVWTLVAAIACLALLIGHVLLYEVGIPRRTEDDTDSASEWRVAPMYSHFVDCYTLFREELHTD